MQFGGTLCDMNVLILDFRIHGQTRVCESLIYIKKTTVRLFFLIATILFDDNYLFLLSLNFLVSGLFFTALR